MGPGVTPGIANVKLPKNKIENKEIAKNCLSNLECKFAFLQRFCKT